MFVYIFFKFKNVTPFKQPNKIVIISLTEQQKLLSKDILFKNA